MFKILSFDQKPDFYHFSQSVELKQKNNKNGRVAVRTCVCACVVRDAGAATALC